MVGFVNRRNKAQDLCNELFIKLEGPLGEAWMSDEAGTDDPQEFLQHVEGALLALEEARGIMKNFLRKHRKSAPTLSNGDRASEQG